MKERSIKILLCLTLCLLLVACGKANDSTKSVTQNNNTLAPTEKADLDQEKTTEPEEAKKVDTATLRDELVEKLRTDNGVVSAEEFVTCLGTDFQVYPDSAFGFVNAVYEDMDNDGEEEVIAAISKRTGESSGDIVISIYKFDGSAYVQTCSQSVTDIDFCTQQRIALFHGGNYGYGIVVDKAYWGSYTRAYGKVGVVYWITESLDGIVEACSWDYNNVEYEDDSHIEIALKECGVPYAENCASYNDGSDKLLCTIKHRNVDDFDWANLQNYLTIK